jgi:cysteine desulfurase
MTTTKDEIFFLDNASSFPIDERVIEEMNYVLRNYDANPHANEHQLGWKAAALLEEYRYKLAKLINADESEIIFTSGATESNNLAIKGVAEAYKHKGKHIITMSTEHKCVLMSCKYLESQGFEITYLEPNEDGLIDLNQLNASIRQDTILVSVMLINNETGVTQNIDEIGKITAKHGVFLHTDAAQAFGKIPIDVKKSNINLMSISGHKIYGPNGIGALYISKDPRVKLKPLIHGGAQERGFRSGTVPLFLVAGLTKTAEIAEKEMQQNKLHLEKLRNLFVSEIEKLTEVIFNSNPKCSFPGIVNCSFLYIEGEGLMLQMPEVCVSTGSACNSNTLESSYVIRAMRKNHPYKDLIAHSSIRFSFSKDTTEEKLKIAIEKIKDSVQKLRAKSPLWEMKQQGIDINKIKWSESHH